MESARHQNKTVWMMNREELEEQLKKAPGVFGPDFPYTDERLGMLVEELTGREDAYDPKTEFFILDRVSEWVITKLPELKDRYKKSTEAPKVISEDVRELQQRIIALEAELGGMKASEEKVISSLGPVVEGDLYRKVRAKCIEFEAKLSVNIRERNTALNLLQSERERLEKGRRFLLRYLKERRGIEYDEESSFENIVLALEEVVSKDISKLRVEKADLLSKYGKLEEAYAKSEKELADDRKVMEGMKQVSEWVKKRCDELEEKLRKTEAERDAVLRELGLYKGYKGAETSV